MGRARRRSSQPPSQLHSITGRRLQLNRPKLEDADEVFAYAADPRACRYLGWQPHRCIDETIKFLSGCTEAWRDGRRLSWIIRIGQGEVVGMIEVQLSRSLAGVGYVIAPNHWGLGYATEALSLVADAIFNFTSVPSIWAVCDVENLASARVLEKSGFVLGQRLTNYRSCPNIGPEMRHFFSYVHYRVTET